MELRRKATDPIVDRRWVRQHTDILGGWSPRWGGDATGTSHPLFLRRSKGPHSSSGLGGQRPGPLRFGLYISLCRRRNPGYFYTITEAPETTPGIFLFCGAVLLAIASWLARIDAVEP